MTIRKLSVSEIDNNRSLKAVDAKLLEANKANTASKTRELKTQAVAKVAYEKADTALKVANNQTNLIKELQGVIEKLNPTKATGYTMVVNRNAEGFISSIDVEIK